MYISQMTADSAQMLADQRNAATLIVLRVVESSIEQLILFIHELESDDVIQHAFIPSTWITAP